MKGTTKSFLENIVLRAITIGVLALPFVAAPSVAGEQYRMSVISDSAYGVSILRGKYQKAIARLSMVDISDELFDNINLCVALTKSGQLEEAIRICEAAVDAAHKLTPTRSSGVLTGLEKQRRNRYIAITLSNRGVVRALQGNIELARKDFLDALEANRYASDARANLARLESGLTLDS